MPKMSRNAFIKAMGGKLSGGISPKKAEERIKKQLTSKWLNDPTSPKALMSCLNAMGRCPRNAFVHIPFTKFAFEKLLAIGPKRVNALAPLLNKLTPNILNTKRLNTLMKLDEKKINALNTTLGKVNPKEIGKKTIDSMIKNAKDMTPEQAGHLAAGLGELYKAQRAQRLAVYAQYGLDERSTSEDVQRVINEWQTGSIYDINFDDLKDPNAPLELNANAAIFKVQPEQLATVTSAMAALNKNNETGFATRIGKKDAQSFTDPQKVEAFSKCVTAMNQAGMSLHSVTGSSYADLKNMQAKTLTAIEPIITKLSNMDALNVSGPRALGVLAHVTDNAEAFKDKSQAIVQALDAIDNSGENLLAGHQKEVLDLPKTTLNKLSDFLKAPEGGEPLQLDPSTFNKLLDAVKPPATDEEIAKATGEDMKACLSSLNKAGTPICTSFGQNKMSRLLNLTPEELHSAKEGFAKIENQGNNNVDEKIFNLVLKDATSPPPPSMGSLTTRPPVEESAVRAVQAASSSTEAPATSAQRESELEQRVQRVEPD